jgi:hypothetical protein
MPQAPSRAECHGRREPSGPLRSGTEVSKLGQATTSSTDYSSLSPTSGRSSREVLLGSR